MATSRRDPLRALIERYYGGTCRILTVRRSSGLGAHLFVVDTALRAHLLRTLGTVGRSGGVMEHSAMDLMRPERLVFAYERLMLVALALVDAPQSVLLLGLGGGAMLRHLAAYLPALAVTVVERDPAVIALAREFFHLEHAIVRADAVEMVADAKRAFDVVMVDLYDASGAAPLEEEFWQDCLGALKPGGCLAVNWAGSFDDRNPRDNIARLMPRLPGAFHIIDPGERPNVVQIVPSRAGFRLIDVAGRLREFSARHRLPRENHEILRRCEITARYPRGASSGKL